MHTKPRPNPTMHAPQPPGSQPPRQRGWQGVRARAQRIERRGQIAVRVGTERTRAMLASPIAVRTRGRIQTCTDDARAGVIVLLAGIALCTAVIAGLDTVLAPLPTPGMVYLPLIAMIAYYWGWRHATVASVLELWLVYWLFIPPYVALKDVLPIARVEQLVTLALTTVFVLLLVQLARARSARALREAHRFAAMHEIGIALVSEHEEQRLLQLIAHTACDLAGADFAAFTLRPVDPTGQPLAPAEGAHFHLAAVVGVTKAQEALFRRMPLGGEGLLAPIFRQGRAVRVGDVLQVASGGTLAHTYSVGGPAPHSGSEHTSEHEYALHSIGVPRGHPVVRSFLGAPLRDTHGDVRGGLLLGSSLPDQFTDEDEALLMGLSSQASVALENARLLRAARSRAQELDAVFESMRDGISIVDGAGRIVRENSAAQHIREHAAETSGREVEPSVILAQAAQRARSGQAIANVHLEIGDGTGEQRVYMVSSSPLDFDMPDRARDPLLATVNATPGGADGAVVVWHDITEAQRLDQERRARADIEARQAVLQTLLEDLPSGAYLVRGADARLVLANPAAEAAWGAAWPVGVPMQDFLSTSGVRILSSGGQLLTGGELATVRAARHGTDVRHYQEVIRQPSGTQLPVLLNAVVLDPSLFQVTMLDIASAGVALPTEDHAVLVVLQDVTALKEAEKVKDEFITIAAHELRTPMAAIKGYAEMLERQTARGNGPALADWQAEAIESIDTATSRLVELTDDLLDVTRLQAGRVQLQLEPYDLVTLTRRVAKRFQLVSDQHTIAVRSSVDHVIVCIDTKRIEQVLSNLLGNAIKYSPAGGTVTLNVTEDATHQHALLQIHDNGIGIPTSQQARIFGRFARADNARELGIGGTGLGLYLSREFIERHQGRIWFASGAGEGTTFFIELPLALMDDDD